MLSIVQWCGTEISGPPAWTLERVDSAGECTCLGTLLGVRGGSLALPRGSAVPGSRFRWVVQSVSLAALVIRRVTASGWLTIAQWEAATSMVREPARW